MLFIGRKYSALHAVARNLANGVPLDAAMWNAHCLFGVSVRALYVIWPKFLASDGVFWTSSRGSHPKTQWLLEDVDVQIACSIVTATVMRKELRDSPINRLRSGLTQSFCLRSLHRYR